MLVAHRVGNSPSDASVVPPAVDAIELDVHLFRGRLEVRHSKVLWPSAIRWERWEMIPRGEPRPTLDQIVHAVPSTAHLWLDLKGFDRRLTARVLKAVADRPVTTVSSRSWWILPAPHHVPGLRVVHSVGSRLQRWALGRIRPPVEAVAVDQRLVDVTSMHQLHQISPTVFVWGVRDRERARQLASLGADGLIIDGLDLLAEVGADLAAELAAEP